jgi:hypothetical protein
VAVRELFASTGFTTATPQAPEPSWHPEIFSARSEKLVFNEHDEKFEVAVADGGQVNVCGCKAANLSFASTLLIADFTRGIRNVFSVE